MGGDEPLRIVAVVSSIPDDGFSVGFVLVLVSMNNVVYLNFDPVAAARTVIVSRSDVGTGGWHAQCQIAILRQVRDILGRLIVLPGPIDPTNGLVRPFVVVVPMGIVRAVFRNQIRLPVVAVRNIMMVVVGAFAVRADVHRGRARAEARFSGTPTAGIARTLAAPTTVTAAERCSAVTAAASSDVAAAAGSAVTAAAASSDVAAAAGSDVAAAAVAGVTTPCVAVVAGVIAASAGREAPRPCGAIPLPGRHG